MKTIIFITILLVIAKPLYADIIYFKSGRSQEGEIVKETVDTVTIKTAIGDGEAASTYPRSNIDKIEKAPLKKRPPKDASYMKKFIDTSEWGGVRYLIKDKTGDVSSPDLCDFKSLKARSVNGTVQFLVELAVGWEELYTRTKSTDSVGDIYLNVDKNKKTGYDGGVIFVKGDGTEERKIEKGDPRVGAEYRITINTGFRGTFQKGSSEMIGAPIVEYIVYRWDRSGLDWEIIGDGQALSKGPFIEISIPAKNIGLEKGGSVEVVFEEASAYERKDDYSIATLVL